LDFVFNYLHPNLLLPEAVYLNSDFATSLKYHHQIQYLVPNQLHRRPYLLLNLNFGAQHHFIEIELNWNSYYLRNPHLTLSHHHLISQRTVIFHSLLRLLKRLRRQSFQVCFYVSFEISHYFDWSAMKFTFQGMYFSGGLNYR